MTPYQIKRSILTAAIQGKLTIQDESEGTGVDLLVINAEEKKHRIALEKLKVGKPCKPISEDDMLFDIPLNWTWARFGDLVLNFDSRRRPVTKEDRKTTKGLYDYFGATGAIDKVDEYIFDGEYLMIGEDGGNFFVDRDNSFIACGKFWANNHVHVVQPVVCEIYYLKHCLDAYNMPNMGLINGIAVPKLNQENMNSILIPVPPLAEQKRIVAKIEELLPLIDRYEQSWSKLEDFNKCFPVDMQKSILQMAIQGKLVPQLPEEGTGEELFLQIHAEKKALIKAGKIKKEKPLPEIAEDEIPFDIPESWKWVRIGSLLHKLVDGTHRTPKYTTSGIPFVSVRNMSNGTLSLDGTKFISEDEHRELWNRCNPQRGDILLSKVGTTGVPAKVETDTEFSLFVSVALLKFNNDLLDINFLIYSILAPDFQKQCKEHTRGVGNKNWVIIDIANTMMPLPPLAEQKRIVAKLEEILPLCERLK